MKIRQHALHQQLDQLATQRWAKRGMRTLLRGFCLALSVWSLALGYQLMFGTKLDDTTVNVLILVCVGIGAALILRPRMRSQVVAHRIDHRYGLQEQIATALEVSARGECEGVAAYLLAKATHNIEQVQEFVAARRRFPWIDVITLGALAMLVVGMTFLVNLEDASHLNVPSLPLPPPAKPGDSSKDFPTEPFEQPSQGNQAAGTNAGGSQSAPSTAISPAAQGLAGVVANALRDQGVTRPAAEALDRGDAAGAASNLRELADQAGQISEQTRRDLADKLRDAAGKIGNTNPDLSTQLRDSAHGLDQGDQQAAQSFDTLANAVEQLGKPAQGGAAVQQQQPPQQNQNQQQNEQQGAQAGGAGNSSPANDTRERARPHERLGVEGVPLQLEGGDSSKKATSDEQAEGQVPPTTGERRFESGKRNADSGIVQAGEDPLRVPADLRDVVQKFFSPPE